MPKVAVRCNGCGYVWTTNAECAELQVCTQCWKYESRSIRTIGCAARNSTLLDEVIQLLIDAPDVISL